MQEDATPKPANRRRAPRCLCTGAVEIFQNESRWGWASVNEISRGGCYIETIQPLPVGTTAPLKITINDLSLEVTARVASNDPSTGMGMEFLAVPAEQQTILTEILRRLLAGGESNLKQPSEAPVATPKTIRISPDASPRILAKVIEQINQKGVLTRLDLVAIVKDCK